jgi:hypothetical protein
VIPQKSINYSKIQISKTVVLSVDPNPSPVVHEGFRLGGRPPVSLITPSASTDSTSAIHNVQLAIKDTNLPNLNISSLKNCTKIPHDIDTQCRQLSLKNSCQGTDMPFSRRFRRMENQYFLDGGRKKLFCPGMVILEQKYHPGAFCRIILSCLVQKSKEGNVYFHAGYCLLLFTH